MTSRAKPERQKRPLEHVVGPADVLRELASLYATGTRLLSAGMLAKRLWPEQRTHNANGQVFPLNAAVAARMLRRCPAVRETEPRRWEILAHRLPPNAIVTGLAPEGD